MKKIISTICILYLLFAYGCAKQEPESCGKDLYLQSAGSAVCANMPKNQTIHIEVAQPNAVLTPKESECSQLGEKIIKECMSVNPKCFELKQQWDARGCGQ